jgi:carbon monoxide dehydrogenase subunit G
MSMELSDEIVVPGKRDDVFALLINPEVLKHCIPGCEELELKGANEYTAKVVLKIGPVKAKFSGSVTLDTTEAPGKLTLVGSGDGGLAGFAKGGADVEMVDQGETTLLKYTAKAETGGKIAQLGARLITSTARKLAKMFFESFEKYAAGGNV